MIVICAIYNINYKLFGRCVCVWLSLRVWVKQMPFKLMLKATEDKQQNQLQQKKNAEPTNWAFVVYKWNMYIKYAWLRASMWMHVCVYVVLNVQLPLNKWLLCSFVCWLGRTHTHNTSLTPINLAWGNIIPNNLYSLQKYSKWHTVKCIESCICIVQWKSARKRTYAWKLKSHMQPQTHHLKLFTKLNESTFTIIAFARRYSSQMLSLSSALSLSHSIARSRSSRKNV